MKSISYLFSLVWRFWLLCAFILVFFIFLPPLFFFTAIMKNNKNVNHVSKYWSKFALLFSGIFWKVRFKEKLNPKQTYIFCANHTSSLDIPLIKAIIPLPLLYIGKKELVKIPVFGYFYKHNSVIVDRKNLKDSYQAFLKAGEKLEQGLNICIFPEGGIPKKSIFLKKFKNGAFKLSFEKNISIVPITIADVKYKFPQEYYKGFPGIIRVTVHKPIKPDSIKEKSIKNLNSSVYNTIFEELTRYENK